MPAENLIALLGLSSSSDLRRVKSDDVDSHLSDVEKIVANALKELSLLLLLPFPLRLVLSL